MAQGQIALQARNASGTLVDYVYLFDGEDGTTAHATVEVIPDIAPYIESVRLVDYHHNVPDTEVVFVPTCTPANPFYVRWINHLGGFEYYMFGQHKVFSGSAGGAVDFFPNNPDTAAAHRTREVLDLTEVKDLATVGAEGLDRDMFKLLKGLVYSPRIDRWNRATEQWEGITHDGTASATWDTHGSLGAVSFVFRLSDRKIQF